MSDLRLSAPRWHCLVLFVVFSALVAGCGSTTNLGSSASGPIRGQHTVVTVLASSTANDELTRFSLDLQSLALVNKEGKSVPLLSATHEVEFMHLNGELEPLVAVEVPQDVYTSATATVSSAGFTCATLSSGNDANNIYYSWGGISGVTVELPQPLTISGSAVALSLNMLVSKSAEFPSSCYAPGSKQFSVTPTFSLTSLDSSTTPVTLQALKGIIQSIGSAPGSITVAGAAANPAGGVSASTGQTWQVVTNSNTVFQGIGNASGLTPGMAVEFDGSVQPDGTVLATRFAVPDPDTTNLMVNTGPLVFMPASVPALLQMNQETEGAVNYVAGFPDFSFGNASFEIWPGLPNVSTLPFPANFNSTNMVAGQMASITSHVTTPEPGPVFVPATTMTLMPQTINGRVTATGSAGAFTTYTVQLAPYSYFPTFAVQPEQHTLLTSPQEVVVYVDQNAHIAAAVQPGPGSTLRFFGVIFNDNGTLRMDCLRVSDGVPE